MNLLHLNIDIHRRRFIAKFTGDRVTCISKIQSYCTNNNFADKSRYDSIFQQVTHKGGESEMKYIKRFLNTKSLSISVGNTYYEDQCMHVFLDNFHQGGKYISHIASHQAELRRKEKCTN